MSAYGLAKLEHSCIQPGLWLIEGHHVSRLPNRVKTQANPNGIRWVVIQSGGQTAIETDTHPTFEDAVARLADHIDKGCDCP